MTLPAFLYARYSTLEQGRGTSLKRQFENARAYAGGKGWRLDPDREISDKGRSAYSGANRSEGGALFEFERQVEQGFYRNGAVFVVEHFDRISRQGWEAVHSFIKLCVENGVSVATLDGDRLYEAGKRIDGATVMELVFKGEGARDEIHKKSVRGKANWQYKVEAIASGAKNVKIGLAPAWLDRDSATNEHTPNNHRVAVLNEIYDLYIEGWGLPAIERLLNGRGEPSWSFANGNGNGWNTAYLHKLLSNRAVMGEFTPLSRPHDSSVETSKGISVPDYFPQAITAEKFNKVQLLREGRRRSGGPAERFISNLFSGSAFCAQCGGPMYYQNQARAGRSSGYKSRLDGRALVYVPKIDRSYLQCNNWRRHHVCTNNARYRYEKLEPAILDAVLGVVIDDKRFSIPDKVAGLSANVSELERRIENKRANLDAIVDSLGEMFIKALAMKAQVIEAEIDADVIALDEMRAELRRESGGTSPVEQLARVREVRGSIEAEDENVRYAARARVKQALSQLVRINCDDQGVATVNVANGLMAWRFTNQGELIDRIDLRNRLDLHGGLTGGELANNAPLVATVIRRTKEAQDD